MNQVSPQRADWNIGQNLFRPHRADLICGENLVNPESTEWVGEENLVIWPLVSFVSHSPSPQSTWGPGILVRAAGGIEKRKRRG